MLPVTQNKGEERRVTSPLSLPLVLLIGFLSLVELAVDEGVAPRPGPRGGPVVVR